MKDIKIFGRDAIEERAIAQLKNCLSCEDDIGVLTADAHVGYGMPIGGAIAYKDKISLSGVGFDIACFTEDTKVRITDGRDLTMLELIDEFKRGKDNFVFSVDGKKPVIKKIINASCTGETNIIIKITLDNNKVIECTPDHIFYLRNGDEIKASALSEGNSLMPLYLELSSDDNFEKCSYRDKRNKLKGYELVYNPDTQLYDFVHFLADNYNLEKKIDVKTDGPIRHHKDFNKLNNNPDNIKRVAWKAHFKLHSEMASVLAKAGKIGFKRLAVLKPEHHSILGRKNMTALHKDKGFSDRLKLRAPINARKGALTDAFKEKIKDNGKRGKKYLVKYNTSKKGRSVSRSVCNEKLMTCRVCGGEVNGLKNMASHYSEKHPGERKKKVFKNHKVLSVEIIKLDKPRNVYCISIEDTHNFALSAGVFVHNCGNYAVRTSVQAKEVNVPSVMDELFKRISFGIGRANNEPVEHAVLDKIRDANFIPQRKFAQMAQAQLGTVGSGNHFIDLFEDEDGFLWIGVHFGSRGFGHKTTTGFIALSKGFAFDEKVSEGGMDAKPILFDISSELGQAYIEAMNLAGEYAYAGREVVVNKVLEILDRPKVTFEVHNHHNFAWLEEHFGEKYWVVRKGCTPAFPGQKGFIGATMADTSVIVEGVETESSKEALYSTVHGAGRIMSRTEAAGKKKWIRNENGVKKPTVIAKGKVDFDEVKARLKKGNIELRGAGADEAPQCYKNLDAVLGYQGETIKVLHRLRPVGVAMAGNETFDPYKD